LASLQHVTAILSAFPRLAAGSVFVIFGRAHQLVLPHPANPDQGTQWIPKLSGGGALELVLSRVDEPAQRVCLRYEVYPEQGRISVADPDSWLVADYNPTTVLAGNNVLPVTIADGETGEIDEVPSSQPHFLITVYRLAFDLLGQLAQQAGLISGEVFSPQTLQAIQDGDVHVTRSQWAGYLPTDVPAFLQMLVVLYEQTIGHGQGIIQLATHLGLTFTRYPPQSNRPLTGLMLQRRQGNKLQYSLSFYDKAARVAQMRQGRTLTRMEDITIRRHVRFDVTVHSTGVLTLVGAAIRSLRQLLQKRPKYFRKFARRFLNEAPRPTVWWLERAVWILAHTTTPDHARQSFGCWLIPQMLRDVLRLDSIASFTAAHLQALLQKKDRIVAAWRRTERLEDDWAGALAQVAHCSKAWIYARRKQLLATHSIDIAFPFAFYRDLVFFGPNSLTPPKVRAALNAALARGDAASNLRLRQQAVKDFDRRRLSIVGASLSRPLLAMSPKVAIPPPTQGDHDQLSQDLSTLPRVAPRRPDVAPAAVGGSEARPRALNLSGGASAAVSDQRPEVLDVATPATPVAKPSGWHQKANAPSAHCLTMLGGSSRSGPSRGQPAPRDWPPGRGDVTAPAKKTLQFWPLPQLRLSLGFAAGQVSESSSATQRKQVVLHSARRDPPMVCQGRVIKLRRRLLWHDVPQPEPRKACCVCPAWQCNLVQSDTRPRPSEASAVA
jgi:hypothetical protein